MKIRDKSKKNSQIEEIANAYKKVKEKHPNICDANEIEKLARKYLMRKKLLKSAGLFLGGNLLVILIDIFCYNGPIGKNLITSLLGLIGCIMVIVGVCTFAKSLHDPLTPKEAQELAEKDKIEKG